MLAAICLQGAWSAIASAQGTAPFTVRGRTLTLRLLGPPSGEPIIVASGDGGWIHLGPEAADTLARVGYRVIGFDSRQYLAAFTSGKETLREPDVTKDFAALLQLAAQGHRVKPILVGVSEGAGLCVLAASEPGNQSGIRGVVGLGLPDLNELGWRWKDAVIYVTKGIPDEPTFSVDRIIDRVSPLPLAAIHSTHDEFVPVSVIKRLMDRARDPKRLWLIQASNYRFGGSEDEFRRRLLEAIAWVKASGR